MPKQRKAAPGRPHKFGRPARLVSLTLPEDVLDLLGNIHPDPGWAIVTLCERASKKGPQPRVLETAELVQLPKVGGLIVVKPGTIQDIEGVSPIPLADGRALIALKDGRGIADLELALVEKLEDENLDAARRSELRRLCQMVREWRKSVDLTFQARTIIMARRSQRRAGDGDGEQPVSKPRRDRRTRRPFLALSWWMHAANVAAGHALAGSAAALL